MPFDPPHPVEHAAVIPAAKSLSDAGHGEGRQLPHQVHGDVAWKCDSAPAYWPLKIGGREPKPGIVRACRGLDVGD